MKTIKKLTSIVLLSTLLLGSMTTYAQDLNIYVNGQYLELDTPPITDNFTTFVPIRFIVEALGVNIDWLNPNVIIRQPDEDIILTVGTNVATKGTSTFYLLANPTIRDNRVLVPLRFISEQLGATVNYDSSGRIDIIKK